MMTGQEIVQGIEAYVAKHQSLRHWLSQASSPQQRAELELAPGAGKTLAMPLSRNPAGPSLYKLAPKSAYRVAEHQFIVA